ncbi:hypothetical protein ACOMHN_036044 [Nucella lapillus]
MPPAADVLQHMPGGRRPDCAVSNKWRREKHRLQSCPEKYSLYREKCRDRMRMIRQRKKQERQQSELCQYIAHSYSGE